MKLTGYHKQVQAKDQEDQEEHVLVLHTDYIQQQCIVI